MGYLAVRTRDRRLVDTQQLAATRVEGRWHWVHELPVAPRDELRARHLATVCAALDEAGIDHFVVPDPSGRRPQVGVLADRMRAALDAVTKATAGQAWYAARGPQRTLLARTGLAEVRSVILFPRYRALGTRYLTGSDLGVAMVPWRPCEGGHEPSARNAHVSLLRPEDLEQREPVWAHGRRWSSLAVFSAPHPEAVPPLRWLVLVPRALRAQYPEVADLLGRNAARSVWFHTAGGSSVTLLDDPPPAWVRDHEAIDVRPPGGEDALAWLVEAWAAGEGPAVALPAGGVLVGDVPGNRLVSAGGLGLFLPDPSPLELRPPAVGPDATAEARALRDWFQERTGAWMPFSTSAVPSGLPAPDQELSEDLARLVADPTRPLVTRPETAVLVVLWQAWLRGRAVPGTRLPASRHRAGTRRFTQAMARLATSPRRTEAVSVEPDSLVEADGAVDHVRRMLADRLPRPAPWE